MTVVARVVFAYMSITGGLLLSETNPCITSKVMHSRELGYCLRSLYFFVTDDEHPAPILGVYSVMIFNFVIVAVYTTKMFFVPQSEEGQSGLRYLAHMEHG